MKEQYLRKRIKEIEDRLIKEKILVHTADHTQNAYIDGQLKTLETIKDIVG